MARIPTMNPMSITAPPGSAGGVKLGPTGVGAVPIQTPLTQRYNPSEFGQQGAAIAQLGQAIFNDAVIPMMELQKRNARAKQTLQESDYLYTKMGEYKNKLNQKQLTPGFDYLSPVHESKAWAKHFKDVNTGIDGLIPHIRANVSDPKHAVALSNSFMPQIMQLKLMAQNREVESGQDRATHAFIKAQRNVVAEIMGYMPTESTDGVYIFKGEKIAQALQRMETIHSVFAASGVSPLDQQKTMEAERKKMVSEIAGALQTNPEMGAEFLKQYGEKLGMTAGDVGETINKMVRFAEKYDKVQQAKEARAEDKQERAAQAELNALVPLADGSQVSVKTSLKIKALNGELTQLALLTRYADLFDRAGEGTFFDKLMTRVDALDDTVGDSKVDTLSTYGDKVSSMLGTPGISDAEIDVLEDEILERKDLSKNDKNTLLKDLSVLKSISLEDSRYKLAYAFLTKQAPVAIDSDDTGPAAQRSRAIWHSWMTDINRLTKGTPEAWRKFDFFGRAHEIVNTHSELWSNPSSDGAQKILKESARQFGEILGLPDLQISVSPSKESDRGYPDVNLMDTALQENLGRLNKEQRQRAVDEIAKIRNFPGLSAKVTDIRNTKLQEQISLNQKREAELKEKLESQESYRKWTPDVIEDFIREKNPGYAEKVFGEGEPKTEPAKETVTQPIAGVEPVESGGVSTTLTQPRIPAEEELDLSKIPSPVIQDNRQTDMFNPEPRKISGSESQAMWEEAKKIGLSPELLTNTDYFPDSFLQQKWSKAVENAYNGTEKEKEIYRLLTDELLRRRALSGY